MQMQNVIHQILEGNFDYENGSLDFSCAKIELSIRKGQRQEGSFRIYAPAGRFTSGTVVSSDWRMECLVGEFTGTEEEIPFCFHGEMLEEGDVVKGTFDIISNQGEISLPFEVSVEHSVPESSAGEIRNLFHFANLAKSNWEEAVELFYSPEFEQVFADSDNELSQAYRALSTGGMRGQSVEEFLILANKKQKVEFLAEVPEISVRAAAFDTSYAVTDRELVIVRNGWGFTQLRVECDGDFLFTEKELLTDVDFLGNRCSLPVFIDRNLCHGGKNFGQVHLSNAYVSLTVPVTVQMGGGTYESTPETDRKRCTAQMTELYLSFRMHRIGTSTWLKDTGRIVERLVAFDENDAAARLFQAQLLITEERYNEAGWILDHVAELFEERRPAEEIRAYYLYLTTLIHGEADYIGKVASEVERIYRRDDSNWRVAWLLLYLSADYRKQDKHKWELFEYLFETGCTSPVLYIEALSVLNANPSLLRKLGRFEQQVLSYGIRQGILKREVTDQLIYLTGRTKEYSRLLLEMMERLYGKKKDVRLIQEICTLLIKGGKTGARYFHWYELGVGAQLRITNLYEYYMMSLDLNEQHELPKSVLMYFSYQNNLDYTHSAYLYDYILQNQDRLGDIYETYRPKIEYFVEDQIRRGHIDKYLADLYSKTLQMSMVNEQTCDALSRLLFAAQIQVQNKELRKVYVYQPGNLRPVEYVLSEGRTWVSLYGTRYTMVFEDAQKNRFVKSVAYDVEKLMVPGRFLRWLLPFADRNLSLDIYMCDSEGVYKEEAEGRLKRALRVASSVDTDSQLKRSLYLRILQYYYDRDDMRALDEYLKLVPAEELNVQERGVVVRYMVTRGNYELAGQWMRTYGPYFIEAKIMVRLVGALMEQNNMAEEPLLTAAAAYVFEKGKYDGRVLEYLILHYQGTTRNMRDIWKAARSFDLDSYSLDERILVQMLYSGAFVGEKMEIFRHYVSQGPKPEVEEAFLAQCAYDFFVRERIMEGDVFREIGHMYLRGEPVQKICKLAFLKYCAESEEETDEDRDSLCESFLTEMLEEGILLDFFRKFKNCLPVQQEIADKTVIEYHADPKCRPCIHYALLHESGDAGEYRAEYMKEAYKGVFFKDFVLFFGESLQYYITEERDGAEQLTESGTLQISDQSEGEESRYRLINDIAISRSMEDFDTMDDLLEEYYRKDFLNSRLFSLR